MKPETRNSKLPIMYDKFAEIYDDVMRQIDYVMWESHVMGLARRWHTDIKDVLSLACGTGSLETLLAQQNLNITCLDVSQSMLEIARRKFSVLPNKPRLVCASMTDFHLSEEFDLVLCLYDSMNYLLTQDEIEQAFLRAYEHLRPGGLYIFDVTTEYNILQNFADYTFAENLEGFSYIWENAYNIISKICVSDVTIFEEIEPGAYRRFDECHKQRLYPTKELRDCLKGVGFKMLGLYDGFSVTVPKDYSERVHFVAQKP